MATSTARRKRIHATPRQREPRVGDLTLTEFRQMVESVIDRRMAQWIDPDAGLELRPEIAASLLRQEQEFAVGKRGKPLGEVVQRLGLG